ncbi:helix-turn-helix transcriptional regulator [Rhodobacter lacus]|uniref:Helix-turn-helix transcriptional regulator n=2 Tax=Rhodobacter lacus TaxID=1641972 RepID=A0ABW5A5C4_9RHOB
MKPASDRMQHRRSSLSSQSLANEVYLKVDEVAARYGVSIDTIYRWKRNGDFPKARKVGPGVTRWRLSDLIEHEANMQACFATHLNIPRRE